MTLERTVAVDTETFLIEPGVKSPQVVCTSVYSPKQHKLYNHLEGGAVVAKLLDGGYTLVFTNPGFDWMTLCQQDPFLFPLFVKAADEGRIRCVAIQQKLIDIEHGSYGWYIDSEGNNKKRFYSLDALTQRHLGVKLDKSTWRLRYAELFNVPIKDWPPGARQYALDDTKATYLVHEHQARLVDPEQAAERTRFDIALYYMSREGMNADPERVEAYAKSIEDELDQRLPEMVDAGFYVVKNKGKVGQINLFTGEVVEPAYKKSTENVANRLTAISKATGQELMLTDKGNVMTDENACRESGDELLMRYAEFIKLQTTYSKDIAFLRKGVRDGRINTRFDSLKINGRSSSSGPNLQNLGRKPGTRECLTPTKGLIYLDADFSTADLHSLAQSCLHLFGWSKLAEALNAGLDPHREFCAQRILQTSYEEAPLKPRYKELRTVAKQCNFSFGTGIGNATMEIFLRDNGVTLPKDLPVPKLKRLWFQQWPEVQELFDYVQAHLPRIQLAHASRRVLMTKHFTEGVSMFLQAVTADGAGRAVWDVFKDSYLPNGPLSDCTPVLFVHDEILMEAPDNDTTQERLDYLCKRMGDSFSEFATPDVYTPAEGELKTYFSK